MVAQDFDVVVVGASLAGCTTATLLAREGLKVAVVERHAKADAHKALCTHFIQASAMPVMRRLGIDRLIEEAGGMPGNLDVHSPAGWIGCQLHRQQDPDLRHGYSIRRLRLDPMLRQLTAETPGVTMMLGASAKGLVQSAGRITGVELGGSQGKGSLTARLVVAADGRLSSLATLAGAKAKSSPNLRFGVLAPMRHVDLQRGSVAQMWFTGTEVAYIFPNDDGVTLVAWMGLKESFDSVQGRSLEALTERIRSLPGAPQLKQAELAGDVLVVKDYPNLWRPAAVRGMALVGDAHMSLDYLHGVGCGWALQSGAWLCDAVAADLAAKKNLDAGLERYGQQLATLHGHRFMINDFSRNRSLRAVQRLLFSAAAKDIDIAAHTSRFGARIDKPQRMLAPSVLIKAIWVNLTRASAASPTDANPPG